MTLRKRFYRKSATTGDVSVPNLDHFDHFDEGEMPVLI